ncbi:thiamine pyrophosphate-requiring protein [Candidatus Scalindua japonica]|uniref:Thiamine pyrophosphate-requiring protein n=1 Tax=Candidatus Scalindua japonica TaxID=1284222 RepID=A0A286TYC4_9BACT|nr:thiamine pyrophosphate-dependent enzyme [Candidatus Scalindua japonica]GAX60895.1 thiamine pyrophosphate-requiring protein [Candidatus Scalindua japonica]
MNYKEVITTITELLTDQLVVCANGLISREAFTIRDRTENFYMIGSMGMASSIGLGIALNKPSRKVIILEGDGNLLMNPGSLPMTGALHPVNLLHIVLDNEVYASTGNQPTISSKIELEEFAKSAKYAYVKKVTTNEELRGEIVHALKNEGPSFLLVKISDTAEQIEIGRVTHSPEQIKERFMSAM